METQVFKEVEQISGEREQTLRDMIALSERFFNLKDRCSDLIKEVN